MGRVNRKEPFSQNKEEQLRQLKPLADKDSAYLTDLIRKAWNSFSANDKAIYHEEANVTPADLDEWIVEKKDSKGDDEEDQDAHNDAEYNSSVDDYDANDCFAVTEVKEDNNSLLNYYGDADKCDSSLSDADDAKNYFFFEVAEPFHYCSMDVLYPSIIYIIELSIIVLQDDHFASSQKGSIKMLWLKGWMRLRQEQREEYGDRSKKKWICHKKGSTFQRIVEAEFAEFQSALDKEDYKALTTLIDDMCPHGWYGSNNMAEKLFFKMTPSQRDEYYEKLYRDRVTEKVMELFTTAKLTDDHVKGSYCMKCDFDKLNAAERKYFIEKAEKIVQVYHQNLRKGIDDAASIEDYDAIPVFLKCDYGQLDEFNAYNVYAMKMGPLIMQEPRMENLRCFELNLMLKQRWNSMKNEEQQIYEKGLSRIDEIEEAISKRRLDSYDFFRTKEGEKIIYSDLSAEEKAKFNEKALQARKQLLEDYPALMEYFAWQHVEVKKESAPYGPPQRDPPEYDVQMKEYSKKPFIVRQVYCAVNRWLQTTDPRGIIEEHAFNMFANEVCTHECDGGLDITTKWQQWLDLPHVQQAEYYRKYISAMHKEEALKKYWDEVNPSTQIEANMFCTRCAFKNLDKAEMKSYLKKTKRLARRKLIKGLLKQLKQEAKSERKGERRCPRRDTTRLYVQKIDVSHVNKILVDPSQSLEYNAFYQYFKKHVSSFSKDPENQHLPYSRICEKVEQFFWDLPDAKRKPYFDTVIRFVKLKKLLKLHDWAESYFEQENKDSDINFYDLNDEDRADYEKKVLQARVQLLRDNPDLTDYFYFTNNFSMSDEKEPKVNLMVPTPFMCFIHKVLPIMEQQDPKFKKKWMCEKRRIMKKVWNELSKEQKAIYYEKQQRVYNRVQVKQFFEQFCDLTFDEPEHHEECLMSP